MNEAPNSATREIREYPRLELITGPGSEPVSTAEVKAHARVYTDDDDSYIGELITAVRAEFESLTGIALISQSWRVWYDRLAIVTGKQVLIRGLL